MARLPFFAMLLLVACAAPLEPDDDEPEVSEEESALLSPGLPGGRANWVVSHGVLAEGKRGNVVRIGTYVFDAATLRVTAKMWRWSQSSPVKRVGTGIVPDGNCSGTPSTVRKCEILTAQGFGAAPNDVRTGIYRLRAENGRPFVSISWDTTPSWGEQWFIDESADGKYASFTFKYNRRATLGYGYGSQASLAARKPMSEVRAHPDTLKMAFTGWAHDVISTRGAVPFKTSLYGACTNSTNCLTYKQPSSETSCKAGCVAPYNGDTSIQYYMQALGTADRRDTYWHWCTCLAKANGCYFGNSHVKPMLQILDDDGAFRGWVGVEASFNVTMPSDPRSADMLQVFRIVD